MVIRWIQIRRDHFSPSLAGHFIDFVSEVVPILTASFQGTDSVIAKALVKAKDGEELIRSS